MGGLSRNKYEILADVLTEHDINFVAITEIHSQIEKQLHKRDRIHGYELIGIYLSLRTRYSNLCPILNRKR